MNIRTEQPNARPQQLGNPQSPARPVARPQEPVNPPRRTAPPALTYRGPMRVRSSLRWPRE